MNRTFLALLALLALFVVSSGGAPSGPVEKFIVPEGAALSQVEDSLAAHRLLGWRPWFRIVARVGKFERELKPGIYQFAPGTSALAILRDIRDGRFLRVKFTVPEGFTSIDIAESVASRFPTTRDSVLAAIRDPSLLREYDIPAPSAEGYLAPDTDTIAAHSPGRTVVPVLRDHFPAGWVPRWASALAPPRAGRAQAREGAVGAGDAWTFGQGGYVNGMDPEIGDRSRQVALTGVFYGMRAQLPAMARAGGAIVNMASILGQVGFRQAAAYVAAKHGILGLTQTAAPEYGPHKIRINAGGPGSSPT